MALISEHDLEKVKR